MYLLAVEVTSSEKHIIITIFIIIIIIYIFTRKRATLGA